MQCWWVGIREWPPITGRGGPSKGERGGGQVLSLQKGGREKFYPSWGGGGGGGVHPSPRN